MAGENAALPAVAPSRGKEPWHPAHRAASLFELAKARTNLGGKRPPQQLTAPCAYIDSSTCRPRQSMSAAMASQKQFTRPSRRERSGSGADSTGAAS